MNELEVTQPEENLESAETTERAEGQALQDATNEPGARIEETQTFEQSEAVEEALKESMETAQREDAPDVEFLPPATDDDSEIMKDHPGPGGNVAKHDDPAEPQPPPDAEGHIAVAESSEPSPWEGQIERDHKGSGGLDPDLVDRLTGSTDPGDDGPPPNRGDRFEGGGEDGGEATPINLPAMPDDDNEATPINLP